MPSTFRRREFDWVVGRFGLNYDLVYVDPLLCDPRLHSLWFKWPPGEQWRRMGRQAFVRRITFQMRARPQDSIPAHFLQPGGAGMRFKADRQTQARAQKQVDTYWSLVDHRQYSSAAFFTSQREALRPWANQPGADSLVVIDAALGKITHVPESIRLAYQQSALYYTPTLRSVECILSDSPAPLLTLDRPAVPLMVDQNAFYNWTEEFYAILNTGWYPFARVVGLYGANAGGKPFVDVLAILIRAYPAFDDLLLPRPGHEARRCLAGTLRHMKRTALDPAVAAMRNLAANPGLYAYDRDEEFLSPLLFFLLACQLHGVHHDGLSERAPQDYRALNEYTATLRELGQELTRLNVRSQILQIPDGVAALLP